jgi:hypothetical protein
MIPASMLETTENSTTWTPYVISNAAPACPNGSFARKNPARPPGTATWVSTACNASNAIPASTGRPSMIVLLSEMVRAALSSRSAGSHGRSGSEATSSCRVMF